MNEYERTWCQRMIAELFRWSITTPFRNPVDPVADSAPDYFQVVKNPMDLSKIRQKVNTNAYKNANEFTDDVLLICSNAKLYNGDDSVYGLITDDIEKWILKQQKNKSDSFDQEWTDNLDKIVKKLSNHISKKNEAWSK